MTNTGLRSKHKLLTQFFRPGEEIESHYAGFDYLRFRKVEWQGKELKPGIILKAVKNMIKNSPIIDQQKITTLDWLTNVVEEEVSV